MPRRVLSLDGTWEFFPDPEQRLTPETLDESGDRRMIAVPGPWQAQFADLRDYSGVAWYRTTFEVTGEGFQVTGHGSQVTDPGSGATLTSHRSPVTYALCFGAVDYHAAVWLNGQAVGEHEGGYLPFEARLDDAIRTGGPNELVVRVIDPGDLSSQFPDFPFAEIPHGKQSWYGPVGGIWQSVRIEARHPIHLTRLRITPDVPGARAIVDVALSEAAEHPLTLLLTVTDPREAAAEHARLVDPGTRDLRVTVPIPDPLLWDTRSPHLYRMEAELMVEGGMTKGADSESGPDLAPHPSSLILDTLASTFGMRAIATSPDGHLMLNGRLLYLRGALDQDYYPHTIYTPFSDAELDEQFAKARHMGLNCLRTHIKITDPRYYAAADRAGLLIWTELPNWETLTEAAKRRARETLAGMVERDWNHPSIVIWTIINEGWGVDLMVSAEHRAWLVETYAFLKELDPHRLVVGNSPCFGNFHVVTDIEDFHNYYAIPDHYSKWCDWVQTFAARPPWTFATTYAGVTAWREYARDPWNPVPRTPAPEVRRRGDEPMVISEFGNWGLPDVAQLKACYGGEEPWWFETGIEWGDGVVYPHGIEQRFRVYHLDKVFGSLSELTAASQRMQFTALKYEIEQIRRFPSIVGYIITEFTDVHWEANGLLDICRNPKTYYDVIGNINGADAIVPNSDRVAFYEGERCEVQLALSHFSPDDLLDSRLVWRMDVWPDIAGVFAGIAARSGTVAHIGTVAFDVPPLKESVRGRLELQLYDADGNLVTANHHELYAFPRAAGRPPDGLGPIWAPELAESLRALGYATTERLEESGVALAATMTDDMLWHMQRGGRVLWFAESSAAKETYLGSLGIAERRGRSWQGDWASNFNWIRQSRMFQSIPTGGTVDFAFADLIPDAVIVGLSPHEFAENVHAGLTVGWLHHTVALIAERPYGVGRLLVSTFKLQEHLLTRPVAQIMLRDMLGHLAGGRLKG